MFYKSSLCFNVQPKGVYRDECIEIENTNIIFHRRNILDCDVVFLVTFSLAKSFWRELLINAETELWN